jgi:ADP-ribose pyrophosphatase YjhB (NUDIX family)
MERRIAVRAIIINNGQLLCARLKEPITSNSRDFWCVPGGGLDDGETLINCLNREIVEELGIKPVIGNLLYVQQYKFGKQAEKEELEFFFHVTNSEDFLNIDLSKTSHGQKEIEIVTFIDPKNYNVLPKFLTTESFDMLGPEAKIFSYL